MTTAASRHGTTHRVWWMFAGWFTFALLDAGRSAVGMYASGMHHDWWNLFWLYFLGWLPWAMATPFILKSTEALAAKGARVGTWIAPLVGLVVMFLISSLWFAWLDTLLDPWLAPGPPRRYAAKLGDALYGWVLPSIILYAFMVAIGMWLRSRATVAQQKLETARLNEQLAIAELSALRQQIEPHFLFNTLNGIVGLLREHRVEPAIGAVVDLSELLRGTLQRSARPFATLGEELELLTRYLDIQKTRFGDRLNVEHDVPTALHSVFVPAPILQPLVENAIKHGIAQRDQGGWIRIRAQRCDEQLCLHIYNDGPSLAQAARRSGTGIGLTNLRKRLEILFAERFSLQLHDRDAGVEVAITLPIDAESHA